jgi:reactive chlorine resistance protein C
MHTINRATGWDVTRASFIDRHVEHLGITGLGVLRYGLVFLLLLWGGFKFFDFEARAIQPLIEHSPFLAWLYPVLGLRGTSALIGVFEVTAAALIAIRRWSPRLSGYGSLMAAGTFVVTLSFLFTTPGALSPTSPVSGFLLKDILLFGAALFTAAEALRAARIAEIPPGAEIARRQ